MPQLWFLQLLPSSIQWPGVVAQVGSTRHDRVPRHAPIIGWLSRMTPRWHTLSTTGTLVDNTGMTLVSTCFSCWPELSHTTCVLLGFSRYLLARIHSLTLWTQMMKLWTAACMSLTDTLASVGGHQYVRPHLQHGHFCGMLFPVGWLVVWQRSYMYM